MHNLTIPVFSNSSAREAEACLNSLSKLPGSLGSLEDLAIRLAGITDNSKPSFPKKSHILFASDHDITLHGLSTAGQEITEMQVRNFVTGGATINAFCRNSHTELTVVDMGVKRSLSDLTQLQNQENSPLTARFIDKKIMNGAHDFSEGPAMSKEQALACVQVGIDIAREEAKRGVNLLATGEMGIGNTSPSSAISSVLTGCSVASATGMGSGISPEFQELKIKLLEKGIALNKPDKTNALDVLAKVGGPEIGAMMGLMLGGAENRIPVVVDGFIAGAAAALAVTLKPEMRSMLIGSHNSKEAGHKILMDYIGIPTYYDLGLRLGEGTGAVLFFPMIDASVRILTEMISFKDMLDLYK